MDTPPLDPDPVPPLPPSDSETAKWITILHVGGLAGLVTPSFGNILVPLIIWLIKKDEMPALDGEGRRVLNFQISYTIYFIVAGILALNLSCLIIPIVLPVVVGVAWFVFTVMGIAKANNGEGFKFPFALKML